MGLSRKEAEVARRLDDGQSRRQIAAETGIPRMIVDRVAGWSNPGVDRQREAAIRAGTKRLSAAIAASGGSFR